MRVDEIEVVLVPDDGSGDLAGLRVDMGGDIARHQPPDGTDIDVLAVLDDAEDSDDTRCLPADGRHLRVRGVGIVQQVAMVFPGFRAGQAVAAQQPVDDLRVFRQVDIEAERHRCDMAVMRRAEECIGVGACRIGGVTEPVTEVVVRAEMAGAALASGDVGQQADGIGPGMPHAAPEGKVLCRCARCHAHAPC